MNIGTKANAIDDLGKFDGNKITIKVAGKQIYPQKRYSIVRVDGICPLYLEQRTYKCEMGNFTCEKCYTYGDTKEQLIRKVAQALLIDAIERYRKAPNCDVNKTIIEHEYRICLEKAQFIVEFLGVK